MPVYLLVGKTQSNPLFFDYTIASDPLAAEQAFLSQLAAGIGVNHDGSREQIQYAIFEASTFGTIIANADPAQATIQSNGNTVTQVQLLNAAATALQNNQTYLGIGSPTTAQAVAQVRALTQQIDGLIRFAIQNFSGTT